MKKKIYFFCIYFLFSLTAFSDHLLTNGEISFYFQQKEKEISYIRGDAFYPIDISRIRFYWLTEDEDVIDLQKKVKEIQTEFGNLLKVEYSWTNLNKSDMRIFFLPSFRNKKQLYFFIEINPEIKGRFVVQIVPQNENEYLQKNQNSLEYGNVFISTNQKNYEILLSKNSSFEEFKLQKLLARAKKYQGDSLYYIFENVEAMHSNIILNIDFYQYINENIENYEEVFQREIKEVKNFFEPYCKEDSSIVQKNLENLDLLSSRVHIPSEISYAKTKNSYQEKQQLLLLRALYHMPENENRILEDVNIRKKELESVIYFYYAFLYAEKLDKNIDYSLVKQRLSPQILSMYDQMTEDGRLISAEDSLFSYVMYQRLLSLLENRIEFYSDRKFIQERKQRLEKYIFKNFLQGETFKDRSLSQESNVKNIEYIFLFPKEKRNFLLKKWFEKYYNKKFGVILYPGEDTLDMIHNLKMVSILYQSGMKEEGTRLLEHLEIYIQRSQNFVLEEYKIDGKEESLEISSRGVYYYLKANLDRENSNGNER